MRYRVASILGSLLLLWTGMIAAGAQEATPASDLASLGLPALDITVTAAGYEGIPAEIAAGRYLVTLTATEDASDFGLGGIGFVQPSGMTADQFLTLMEAALGGQQVSPMEQMMLATALFQSGYAGGAYTPLGQSVQMVIDLGPGEWIAWGEDPFVAWEPVVFTVTGEMPADLPEPASTVTLSMGEYVFEVTGGELTAGQHVIRVDNIGAQPHFVESGRTDVAITEADVEAILASFQTGTPAAVDFDIEEDLEDAFRTGALAPGATMWLAADVTEGTYLLTCFFPDAGDLSPHAFHGMYAIIEVD
jgi:hypothetical protein